MCIRCGKADYTALCGECAASANREKATSAKAKSKEAKTCHTQ